MSLRAGMISKTGEEKKKADERKKDFIRSGYYTECKICKYDHLGNICPKCKGKTTTS